MGLGARYPAGGDSGRPGHAGEKGPGRHRPAASRPAGRGPRAVGCRRGGAQGPLPALRHFLLGGRQLHRRAFPFQCLPGGRRPLRGPELPAGAVRGRPDRGRRQHAEAAGPAAADRPFRRRTASLYRAGRRKRSRRRALGLTPGYVFGRGFLLHCNKTLDSKGRWEEPALTALQHGPGPWRSQPDRASVNSPCIADDDPRRLTLPRRRAGANSRPDPRSFCERGITMAAKPKTAKPETTEVTDTATETIKATTEQVKGKIDQALKAFEDAGASSKETYEAFVSSFNITVKGFEGVSAETAAYTKKAVEDLVAVSKSVVGAKSLREVVDIQNDYTKAAFDNFLAFTNKIGEMTVQFTQEAVEPVSRQLGTVFKKFAQPVA
ncbi:hypothetical protein DKG74_03885 [Zavarzinia aquatilis]|uniref:Phasin domain-containing protein n=2 Tax=Zavarzinia aquatilis TaxID=2211142 RepID=A0A317ED15_9PROT|nr:hypothetical protein DKG74_03885 [Zavarzinia aquatilis]